MNRKMVLLVLLLMAIGLAGVPKASAQESHKAAFEANYSSDVGTRIDQCLLCHTTSFGFIRNPNPYGTDYQKNGLNFTMIELLDSDGDGFTNIDEIHNLTFPGDAKDFPGSPAAGKTTTGISAAYTLIIIVLIAIYLKMR